MLDRMQSTRSDGDRILVVSNPRLPYWGSIPGGFVPGTKILIEGCPTRNSRRFSVNIVMGDTVDHFVDENDIAFHYNARFDQNSIVRNTRIRNKWGEEEWAPLRNPFMRNVMFTLQITVDETCYRTAVNNSHFIEYNHRLRRDMANLLCIHGDVQISRIRFESPQTEARRDSVPSLIYSESQATYLSCVPSEPFQYKSDETEQEEVNP